MMSLKNSRILNAVQRITLPAIMASFSVCLAGDQQSNARVTEKPAAKTNADTNGQTRVCSHDDQLKQWLQNMIWYHRFESREASEVTGLSEAELSDKLKQFGIHRRNRPVRPTDKLFVLPYPGGRHPRIGFLDGAIDPQRETKLSVFCPWDEHSYAVLDVPEAIWSNLGLTYLAHTHIDTIWTKQGIKLEQLEWSVSKDGAFEFRRRMPSLAISRQRSDSGEVTTGDGIEFGTRVVPRKDHLQMSMWLKNGTKDTLTDLRVQNCVMLKAVEGFDAQTNDNKLFVNGYAIAGSADSTRWIISAWDPIHRAWGNAPCPCLHSDPKFEDCPPGEVRQLRGWFSFYQGTDIHSELARIESTGWRNP